MEWGLGAMEMSKAVCHLLSSSARVSVGMGRDIPNLGNDSMGLNYRAPLPKQFHIVETPLEPPPHLSPLVL